MKCYILIGMVLAFVILMLSLGMAQDAKENTTILADKNISINNTLPDNTSVSSDLMPKMKFRIAGNTSIPMNVAMNIFILQNVTINTIMMQNTTLPANTSTA